MALVSLILPIAPGTSSTGARAEGYRQALEAQGHRVDVQIVEGPGLAAAAVSGLRKARGDLLVVLDDRHGYDPSGLPALIAPLIEGEADLSVARPTGRGAGGMSWLMTPARPLLGTCAPFSGLIALTRDALKDADESLAPIGARFALELLVRVDGRRAEVAILAERPAPPPRVTLDDLRHIKRLADDRFGTLSRLVQFCLVGASGMVVDLTCYALFQLIFSRAPIGGMTAPVFGGTLDLAVAGALAIAVALVWNFSLNRRLTFSYARQGSWVRQFVTYAMGNALGIVLSFSLRLFLPAHVGFFQRHRLAAALVGIVAATGISFSMSRWVVFSRRSVDRDHARRNSKVALAEATPAP